MLGVAVERLTSKLETSTDSTVAMMPVPKQWKQSELDPLQRHFITSSFSNVRTPNQVRSHDLRMIGGVALNQKNEGPIQFPE